MKLGSRGFLSMEVRCQQPLNSAATNLESQHVLKNAPSRESAPAETPPLKKSDRTRAAILEAARTLFAERGYESTTVREIASAANADPALVIRYFGSKEELFVRATEFELRLPDVAALKAGNEGEALVRHFFEIWEKGPSATSMAI